MADKVSNMVMLFDEFLESSSSSSESELESRFIEKGGNKPRIERYVEDVVHNYSSQQFKSTFRLKRSTVEQLIEKFSVSQYYVGNENHSGSPMHSAENHILTFVWFAANKCCLRDVAERFGVGQTTAFNQIERVINYLVDLSPNIIKFPETPNEKEFMAEEFRKVSGVPGILGCIDGTYIEIRTPAHKIKSTYVNRHDKPSLTLQGICDYRKKFIDCFTGPPGKMHDSRVFRLSFISQKLPEICGENYHLLGDGAYALRQYLLTPYKDYGNITPEQRLYNEKFCATRVLIENTFGLLKTRFRQLQVLEFHHVNKMANFILACCVLHNLCIDNEDLIEINEDQQAYDAHVEEESDLRLRQLGEQKRSFISATLNNLPPRN